MPSHRSKGIPLTSCTCLHCGDTFTIPLKDVRLGRGKYCKRACSADARRGLVIRSVEERFWAKVNKDGPVVCPDLGPCWLWTGGKSSGGYGMFYLPPPNQLTHRVAWEMAYGSIPETLDVCHHCDVRHCVRATHLFLGTRKENMEDAARKGTLKRAAAKRKLHHPDSWHRGEDHYIAKLTDQKVLEMRGLYATSKYTVAFIAREYNIGPRAARSAILGETWQHI